MLHSLPEEPEVLEKLVAWGAAHPAIRAVILTSSRARSDGSADLLADYDIILAVTDADQFGRDDAWVSAYGRPMVRDGDQGDLYSLTTYWRGVVYEDGVKIDYSAWPSALLERIATEGALPDKLDVGYRVLLDKDRRTAAWQPSSYQAHIPAKPAVAEYRALVEAFWWSATYVARSLWRDELVFARWCLDQEIKILLVRRLLEWRIELDHGWSVRPGVNGRGLKRWLPAEIWSDFANTYVGPDIEDNWIALFHLAALFRRVAAEVGTALGYPYPQPLDDRVSAYWRLFGSCPEVQHHPVRAVPRPNARPMLPSLCSSNSAPACRPAQLPWCLTAVLKTQERPAIRAREQHPSGGVPTITVAGVGQPSDHQRGNHAQF